MGKPNFSEDFKRDAVHQITVRGYPVREVSVSEFGNSKDEKLEFSTYGCSKTSRTFWKTGLNLSSFISKDRTSYVTTRRHS